MLVRKLKYRELCQYISTRCQFRSDCEFFPSFNVTGTVVSIKPTEGEYEISVKTEPTGKIIPIGSNMRNLTIEKL